ncbi:MAG TPA: TadE/TadG family type IV pilus assembly protein [Candidatus Tectomicrobia bacterium]|jgi:Flp pilus assembly protein TadG
MRWRRTGEDGVIAVEFALLLPMLMALVAGIIEFGLGLYFQEVITNASREAARAGIVIGVPRPTAGEIKNVALTYLTNLGVSGTASYISVTGAQGNSGTDLTVRVDLPYRFVILPGFLEGFVSNITLRAATTMKHE